MKIFVITENAKATDELCSGARYRADEVALISLNATNILENAADTIYAIAVPQGAMYEDAFGTILDIIRQQQPDALYIEPTRRLKVISGRLAAALGTSAVTDVMSFEADGYATSMYFGGVAMRRQSPTATTAIFTIASGTFEAGGATGANQTVALDFLAPSCAGKLLSSEQLPPQEVDLTAAKRVIAVGRGSVAEADLQMIYDLGKAIGAELGCTRPITENEGWLPRELYIGISGVSCKPDLYIGIGLSGQMQHTVGVNRSRVFCAINKDKNAPIFKQADYGLVADLYAAVPRLTAGLAQA
jgi:electron transfer flavoprotein alpha subunit